MGKNQVHGQPGRDAKANDGPVGNRPANNARIGTPGSVADASQRGAGDAADFLGLNQEFGIAPPPQQAPPPQSFAQPAPLPAAQAEQDDAGPSWLFQAQEPAPVEAPVEATAVDEPVGEPAPEIAYQEPERPVRRLKPALMAAGAAAVVGMIGFATWSAFRASQSTTSDERAPSVVDASAVPQQPKLVEPAPTAASRYPGRRSVATGELAPTVPEVADGAVATFAPDEPLREPAEAEANLFSGDTASLDVVEPPPTQWLESDTDSAFASTDPGAAVEPEGTDEAHGSDAGVDPTAEVPSDEEVDSYDEVPEVDLGSGAANATSSNSVDSEPARDEPAFGDVEAVVSSGAAPIVDGEPDPSDAAVVAGAESSVGEEVAVVVDEPDAGPADADASSSTAALRPEPESAVAEPSAPAAPAPVLTGSWNGWSLITPPMPRRRPDTAATAEHDTSATLATDVRPTSQVATTAPSASTKPAPDSAATAPASRPAIDSASTQSPVAKTGGDGAPNVEVVTKPSAPSEPVGKSPVVVVQAAKSTPAEKTTDAGGLRRASASDLAGIWTDSSIPFDAIAGPKPTLTPSVGRVRVLLVEQQVLEGLLYSVGQNQVTIATELGRIGVAADRIQKIDRVEVVKVEPGKEGAGDVRIKTPGGIVMGKVISTEGGQTVVQTKDGSRVTFASKDIQVQSGAKVGIKP